VQELYQVGTAAYSATLARMLAFCFSGLESDIGATFCSHGEVCEVDMLFEAANHKRITASARLAFGRRSVELLLYGPGTRRDFFTRCQSVKGGKFCNLLATGS
jgi:hypothetical protein